MNLQEYREQVQHKLSELHADIKVLIEINHRQDKHLEKLNGRVSVNEKFRIVAQSWGAFMIFIIPIVISVIIGIWFN